MSIIDSLDKPVPPALNRTYLVALVCVLLVVNALIMLVHFTAVGFILFLLDAVAAGIIGYALVVEFQRLPPGPTDVP